MSHADTAVRTEVRGKVLWVHLQRPEVLNAINAEMVEGLDTAVDRASRKDVRAMVIRGTGRAFCAGADLVQVPGATLGADLSGGSRTCVATGRRCRSSARRKRS